LYREKIHSEVRLLNKVEFEYEMRKYGDSQTTLANAMGLSRTRLNCKINERYGASFTQPELKFLMDRYSLSTERLEQIFFAS